METIPVIPSLQMDSPKAVAKLDPMAVVQAGKDFSQTQVRRDEVTVPDARAPEFNIKEQFGVGALSTFIGQAMTRYSSPDSVEQADWKTKEDDQWALSNGYYSNEYERSILDASLNRKDWQYRIGLIDDSRRVGTQMANATGLQFAVGTLAQLIGGISTSPVEMVIGGAGAVAATSRVMGVTSATSRLALHARGAAGAAVAEVPSSVLRQNIMQSEAFADIVAQDVVFGAVFDVPGGAFAAKRAYSLGQAKQELGTAQADLVSAIDSGADLPAVQAHVDGVQALKDKIVKQATEDGDMIAAEVYARAGPEATPAEIDAVIRDLKKTYDDGVAAMAPSQLPDAQAFMRPDRVTDALETQKINAYVRDLMAEKGVAVSPEAAQILWRAKNTWDANVPESLKAMQEKLRVGYEFRKTRLKEYGGLAHWLDSPGLIFQLEKSAVTRMLGSMLVESSSGLGKREFSAALDYEKMKSVEHKYVPALKEALLAHQVGWAAKGKMIGMGDSLREHAFWDEVQLDRLMRREHIKNGSGEYISTAPETVQKAGRLLDSFMKEEAEQLKTRGHEEGDAILGGGFVGHLPYRIDSAELNRLFVESPEKFEALRQLLQEQFHEKVLKPGLEDLTKNRDKYLADHKKNLQDTVSALQDRLAGMEDARRALQGLRDDVTTVDAKRKEIWATIEKLDEAAHALRQELAELESPTAGSAADSDITLLNKLANEDFDAFAKGEVLEGELFRADAAGFLESVLLSGRLDEESPEYILGKQLLATSRDDLHPSTLIMGKPTARSGRSWFKRRGKESLIRMRADGLAALLTADPVTALAKMTARDLGVFIHEFAHYRTQHIVLGVANGRIKEPVVVRAVAELELLRKEVAEVLGKDRLDELHYTKYAVSNVDEFIASFFNAQEFRDQLGKQKYRGESLLTRIKQTLLETLGFNTKDTTAFTKAYDAITVILESRGSFPLAGDWTVYSNLERIDSNTYSVNVGGEDLILFKQDGQWYSDDVGSGLEPLGKTPKEAAKKLTGGGEQADSAARVAEIKKQLDDIKANKQALKEAHAAAKSDTDAAKGARAAVQGATQVEEIKAVERSLGAARARLSEAEESPSVVFEKMRLALLSKAAAKSEDLTRKYLRQAMTKAEHRTLGKELHFADMAQSILTENWEGDYVTKTLAENFRAKLQERISDTTRTELDLTQSVKVGDDTVRLLNIMHRDGLAMVKSMAHSTAGKAALARKGMHDPRMQAAALEAMVLDGASEQALGEMKFILDVYSGRVDPGTNPEMWATLRNMTYAAKMGKLGEAQLADLTSAVALTGLGAIPRVFGGAAKMILSGDAFVHDRGLTEFGKQLLSDAPSTMGMDYRLHTDHTEGGAGMGAESTKGFIARMASKGAQMTSILSLSNTVSSVTHRIITPYVADELIAAVHSKSALSDARLADAGLGPNELALIQKYMDKYDAERKPGQKVNWDKWDGEEGQYAADVLVSAIHRGVFQTLQKALIGEKPSWTGKTQVGQTAAQLHSYGLIAAEKQLARNLAHMDANTGVWLAMSLVWASLLYVGRTHANALNQDKADRAEYTKQRLSGVNLANGIFTMWNASGLMPEFMSVGQVLWGNKEDVGGRIETQPRGGGAVAAAGYIGDLGEAASATGNWVRGVEDTGKMLKEVSQIVPGGNTRLVTGILSATR